MIKPIRLVYQEAMLEKVWEDYGRNMSVLRSLKPNDTIGKFNSKFNSISICNNIYDVT